MCVGAGAEGGGAGMVHVVARRAQVFTVPAADGSLQYVWLGNQWVTSKAPGTPRNNDLLYWAVLQFNATGGIAQMQPADNVTLSLP
jgi:hypothetical protein